MLSKLFAEVPIRILEIEIHPVGYKKLCTLKDALLSYVSSEDKVIFRLCLVSEE